MKLKVEPYAIKKGNRVGQAVIEFESTDGFMASFGHFQGFTIIEDENKELFVLFPSAKVKAHNPGEKDGVYFFLKPNSTELLEKLETLILDKYEEMTGSKKV